MTLNLYIIVDYNTGFETLQGFLLLLAEQADTNDLFPVASAQRISLNDSVEKAPFSQVKR